MLDALQTPNLLLLLTTCHLLGLSMGFGAVLCIDIVLVRGCLSNQPSSDGLVFCQAVTQFERTGLYILWLSGLSLLFYYLINSPEKLQSSVLQAKMFLIAILTLNSMIIHLKVLPIICKYRAHNVLANADSKETSLFAVCLAFSVVSWFFPVLFVLNQSFEQRSVAQLLSLYFFALIVIVPFFCAIAFRARMNMRATSLLTCQGRAVITQR